MISHLKVHIKSGEDRCSFEVLGKCEFPKSFIPCQRLFATDPTVAGLGGGPSGTKGADLAALARAVAGISD